jgi:hypothetical protein
MAFVAAESFTVIVPIGAAQGVTRSIAVPRTV